MIVCHTKARRHGVGLVRGKGRHCQWLANTIAHSPTFVIARGLQATWQSKDRPGAPAIAVVIREVSPPRIASLPSQCRTVGEVCSMRVVEVLPPCSGCALRRNAP